MKRFSKQLLGATKKHIIPSIGVLALVIFSGLILFEATKATVDVTQNGEKETVKTHSNTVGELLDELEITVSEHDDLSHDEREELESGMEIEYKEAEQIFVTIDEEKHEYYTTADDVGTFLSEENLAFSERDDLSFNLDDKIEPELNLVIDQAYQVTINNGGEKEKVWSTSGTIEELLADHNIELNKADKIKPALDKEHDSKTVVKITRVKKEKDTIEERLAFQVEEKQDANLEKGKTKVIEEGQEGSVVKVYEVVKENGKEVERELIEEEVTQERKNRVIAVGTKVEESQGDLVTLSNKQEKAPAKAEPKKETSNSPSNNVEQKKATESKPKSKPENKPQEPKGKELTMNATAYSADCNGCSGITATGINLKADRNKKVIAVDPSVIPLGSTVWVEGYGTAIAGDTGGAIKGNRIDLHVPSHEEAMAYGRKTVKIKVLD